MKVFCDSCGKEIGKNFSGDIFGFDYCGDVLCEARLVLRASKENYAKPYSNLIPTEEQINKAKREVEKWE